MSEYDVEKQMILKLCEDRLKNEREQNEKNLFSLFRRSLRPNKISFEIGFEHIIK